MFATRFLKIDVQGVSDELFKDEDFRTDLLMVSQELNISNYLTPKRSLFLRTLQKYYVRFSENKIKNQMKTNLEEIKEVKVNEELKQRWISI